MTSTFTKFIDQKNELGSKIISMASMLINKGLCFINHRSVLDLNRAVQNAVHNIVQSAVHCALRSVVHSSSVVEIFPNCMNLLQIF